MRFVSGILGRIIFFVTFAIFAVFYGFAIFMSGAEDFLDVDVTLYVLSALLIIKLFGGLISFKSPVIGGLIIFIGGLVNGVFLYFRGSETLWMTILVYCVPYLVSGLMIVFSKSEKRKKYY